MPKLYPLLTLLLALTSVGCDETVSTIVTLQMIFPEGQNPLEGVERLRARVEPTDGSEPVSDEILRPDSGWEDLDEGIELGHMDMESATVRVEGLAGDGEVLSVGETIPIPVRDGQTGRVALFVQRIGTSGIAPGPERGWSHHCATYLTGGGVLLVGGADGEASAAAWVYAVDLYEPVELSELPAARSLVGCATLGEHDGLVLGGSQPASDALTYDPVVDSWEALPLPDGEAQSWARPAADRLPDGGVLALRGRDILRFGAGPPASVAFLGDGLSEELREATLSVLSAQLAVVVGDGDSLAAVGIDPANGEELALEQPPLGPRRGHSAARLSEGRLVIAGGGHDTLFEDVEVYDPEAGTWELHAGLLAGHGRRGAPLIALDDDRLVLVGGADDVGRPLADAVVIDLARLRTTAVDLVEPRLGHTVTPLPMGTLLIVGGEDGAGAPRDTIEILRPPLP